MKGIYVLGMLLLAAAMAASDWKKLRADKRTAWSYAGVAALGVLLSLLLLAFPNLPGPTSWLQPLLSPLGQWLKPHA